MKKFASVLVTLLLLGITAPAQNQKHSRVKIWTGEAGMRTLAALGIETDHGDYRKNVWFISDFSEDELLKIAGAGFRYEVLIDNVVAHYQQHAHAPQSSRIQVAGSCDDTNPVYPVPSNFSLGSYAGYFTYQEMLDHLDSMASKYPDIITMKQAIPGGTTLLGDPVYYIKISDSVYTDETEPEVLYTAVHHAREPGGMSQLIFYMWYLLENYGSDPEITAIVNSTELFFIPCINPDGYLYNELNEPNGGGMWRKNRRDNLDGSFGVDLNRNYGYNWGYDDNGSSPDGNDQTYRGDAPFSEPETQLIRDFTNSRNFLIALNYHTYGNLLIYPWGYDYSTYTPDSALYANYGRLLTTYNGFTYGTADQTVQYIVNGSSDDWMYGEQGTKPKIFAMTPECGDAQFGFWPPSSEILPLCQNTMFQNITMALLAGKYALVEDNSPEQVTTGGDYIRFTLRQLGLDTTGTYTLSLTPLTANVVSVGSPVSHGNLGVLQSVSDSISYALTTPMTNGEPIRFLLNIDNGEYTRSDTITRYFGPPTIAFASDCNSTTGWNNGQWGISNSVWYSPSASITDSPTGDYGDNQFKTCRITNPVDLSTAVKATLSFYAKWALEPNYDYVQVQASDNGGVSWTALCGNYTVPGSDFQVPGEPVYEGFQLGWVFEEVSLDEFVGGNVHIRFVLASDNWQTYDGYYFDDVTITKVLPGTNSLDEPAIDFSPVSVMPNPASEYAYVTSQNNRGGIVQVFDAVGRLVMTREKPEGITSVRIPVNDLNSGVYIIRLHQKDSVSAPVKLVVE